jgi:hypothetical protein
MSINFKNLFQTAKEKAIQSHKEKEEIFLSRAEEGTDEISVMSDVRKAYTQASKAAPLQKMKLSDSAIGVLTDLSGIEDEFKAIGKTRADAEIFVALMLESWPRHSRTKFEGALEYLASSGRIVRSTAPTLIMPFVARMVRDGKSEISRQEFVSCIHRHYREQGKSLPSTSPNWPNPFASFVGNISPHYTDCKGLDASKRRVQILNPITGPGGAIVAYRVTDRARDYFLRAK